MPQIIIADRSPLSAIFYSKKNGALLEPMIRSFIEEVADAGEAWPTADGSVIHEAAAGPATASELACFVLLRSVGATYGPIFSVDDPTLDAPSSMPLVSMFFAADVHVFCVHLRTDRDLLWQRITERLEVEPHRLQVRCQCHALHAGGVFMTSGVTVDSLSQHPAPCIPLTRMHGSVWPTR